MFFEHFLKLLEDRDRIRRGVQDDWPGESHTGFEEDVSNAPRKKGPAMTHVYGDPAKKARLSSVDPLHPRGKPEHQFDEPTEFELEPEKELDFEADLYGEKRGQKGKLPADVGRMAKKLKGKKGVDDPFALANWMKQQGHKLESNTKQEDKDRIRRGVDDNWPGESHTGFEEACDVEEEDIAVMSSDEDISDVLGVKKETHDYSLDKYAEVEEEGKKKKKKAKSHAVPSDVGAAPLMMGPLKKLVISSGLK